LLMRHFDKQYTPKMHCSIEYNKKKQQR
jgi:hypothetical protein